MTAKIISRNYKNIPFLNREQFSFPPDTEWNDLIDILEYRAATQPNQSAIIFHNSRDDFNNVSFSELWEQSKGISSQIAAGTKPGDRVIILLRPGLDYFLTFFAILHAGCIAVPLYPPFSPESAMTLHNIIANASPEMVITDKSIYKLLKYSGVLSKLPIIGRKFRNFTSPSLREIYKLGSQWKVIENLKNKTTAQDFHPQRKREEIAFLMYTSGSTKDPKGVIIKHENLIANIFQIASSVPFTPNSRTVTWIPPFHDMGLIGTICLPLLLGYGTEVLSPTTFLKNPLLWLEIISRGTRNVISPSPDFGFELCAKRYSETRCQNLDLSCFKAAMNGSEPIRLETLLKFSQHYKKHGFRPEYFFPCYGLAEATLYVSGGSFNQERDVVASRKGIHDHLLRNPESEEDEYTLISCGTPGERSEVIIVDPKTNEQKENREIGEILVRGANCTEGYWRLPEESKNLHVTIDGKRYIHTGDYGFIDEGHLYVTGRIKDLIIIRGRNFYPRDLEETTESVDQGIRQGCSVAVAINENGGPESFGIIAEIYPAKAPNFKNLASAINLALYQMFQITPSKIVFIRPKMLFKTTSGKLQRSKNRDTFIYGEKEKLYEIDFTAESDLQRPDEEQPK